MARQSERSEGRDNKMGAMQGATRGKAPVNGQQTDAIDMLKADHRRVEELFERFESATRRAEKAKIAQQICLELTVHAEIEEELFYPACREHIDDPLLDQAQVEHDSAKVLVYDIAINTPTSDPFFDAKVKVLAEQMRHHIDEEERIPDSIFSKALEAEVDTAALGEQMQARRAELMEENAESLFLPEPTTLHVAMEDRETAVPESRGRGGRGRQPEAEERGAWGEERGGEYDERRAARGGEEHSSWEEREGGGGARAPRGRPDERGGPQAHRGWHGDPKRHAEASRRGWEHRR